MDNPLIYHFQIQSLSHSLKYQHTKNDKYTSFGIIFKINKTGFRPASRTGHEQVMKWGPVKNKFLDKKRKNLERKENNRKKLN